MNGRRHSPYEFSFNRGKAESPQQCVKLQQNISWRSRSRSTIRLASGLDLGRFEGLSKLNLSKFKPRTNVCNSSRRLQLTATDRRPVMKESMQVSLVLVSLNEQEGPPVKPSFVRKAVRSDIRQNSYWSRLAINHEHQPRKKSQLTLYETPRKRPC